MSSIKSAAKEALEEAGVIGKVSKKMLAEYDYKKYGTTCHVCIYYLEVKKVLKEWREMDKRSRRIVRIDEAIKIVKKDQKNVLKTFYKMIR